MKIGYRLLITLVFVAFVLPFLFKHVFGGKAVIESRQQLAEHDRFVEEFNDQIGAHAEKLYASVDQLDVRDLKFKQCLKNSLADFAQIPSTSSGHITSVTQLPRLLCMRMGITDIKGIEKLTKLTGVVLSDNDIRSLSPLTYHPSLESIDLSGSDNLQNLEVLLGIKTLKKVRFPDLTESYCYEAMRVHEALLQRNKGFDRRPTNAKNIRCRGKKTRTVERLLSRKKKGEKLSYSDKQILREYDVDQSRR